MASVVQSKSAVAATVAFTNNVVAGNSILVALTSDTGNAPKRPPASMSDNLGNVYQVVHWGNDDTNNQQTSIWLADITVAGACTVTGTFVNGTPTSQEILVVEYSGIYGWSIDKVGWSTPNTNGTTATDGYSGPSITPSANNTTLLAVLTAYSNVGAINAGTGWTEDADAGGTAPVLEVERQELGTAAAKTATWTCTATVGKFSAFVMSLKPSGYTYRAPTFIGAGSAVFNAATVVNPTNLTPTKSGSTATGDLMVCVTNCLNIAATVATPSGWTVYAGFPKQSGTASGGRFYVFYRIADGSGSDAPTCAWTGVTTGTSGDSSSARILSYRNVQAVVDGTAPAANDVAAQTSQIAYAGYTNTFNRCLVMAAVMKCLDTAHSYTEHVEFNERSDDSTTNAIGHSTVVGDWTSLGVGDNDLGYVFPSDVTSARALSVVFAFKSALQQQLKGGRKVAGPAAPAGPAIYGR